MTALLCVFDSAVEYTTKLQRERQSMQEEAEMLRKQIQDLNTSIRYVKESYADTCLFSSVQLVFQLQQTHAL